MKLDKGLTEAFGPSPILALFTALGLFSSGASPFAAAETCRPADAVVITCHGRSGSTLMERIFDVDVDAISYYEPLRPWDQAPCFDHPQRNYSLVMATMAALNCDYSTRVPMQCPWHTQLVPRALNSVEPEQIRALGNNRRTFGNYAAQLTNITLSLPACRTQLSSCHGTVAAKIVRIPGMLDMLHAASARALRPAERRLVIIHVIRVRARLHMAVLTSRSRRRACAALSRTCALALVSVTLALQDPRALLHSRYRVGWGVPRSGRRVDVSKWAGQMCSATLRDMQTGAMLSSSGGGGRGTLYLRVRYEDLVRSPLETVRHVYAVLGRPVPSKVEAYFKAVVLKMRGEADPNADAALLGAVKGIGNARRQLRSDTRRSAPVVPGAALGGPWARPTDWGLRRRELRQGKWEDAYATTAVRPVEAIIGEWRSALSREAINAVQAKPKCKAIMAELGYEPA